MMRSFKRLAAGCRHASRRAMAAPLPFRKHPAVRLDQLIAGWLPACWLVIILCIQAFAVSDTGEKIERQSSERLFYFLRAKLSPPPLDPRLKILVMDDQTVAALQNFDLSLPEWGRMIGSIAKQKPAWIFIDKLFDRHFSAQDNADFLASSKTWESPVSVIGFVTDKPIPFRQPLALASIRELFSDTFHVDAAALRPNGAADLAYGAEPAFWAGTKVRMGHAVYQGDNRFRPVVQLRDGVLLPHAALAAARDITVKSDELMVDGARVAPGIGRAMPVNIASSSSFKGISYSLLPVVNRMRRGLAVSLIEPGDYVVVLPAMYTGNTDWRETPFGPLPGGHVLASLVNSTLTKQWLNCVGDPGFAVIAAALLVLLVGLYGSTVRLATLTVLGIALVFIGGSLGLIWFRTLLPATFVAFGMAASAGLVLLAKEKVAQLSKLRIRAELDAASAVQAAFVPAGRILAEEVELLSFFRPASECGGDWWGHRQTAPGIHYIVIGDAIGHGLSAALVTAVSYAVVETLMAQPQVVGGDGALSELFERLNAVLIGLKSENAQMTFQVLCLDANQRKLTVMNAGHPAPLLFPANPADSRLKAGRCSLALQLRSDMLGCKAATTIGRLEVELVDGDRLLIYSDGVIENEAMSPPKLFDRKEIEKVVVRSKPSTFGEFFGAISEAYHRHVELAPPQDDATLVAVHFRTGKPET